MSASNLTAIDTLDAIQTVQDAIIEALTNITPEGGVWTLERLAEQVGSNEGEGFAALGALYTPRAIFDFAVECLSNLDKIVTDGEDIILA